jgi:hypothetical protein
MGASAAPMFGRTFTGMQDRLAGLFYFGLC